METKICNKQEEWRKKERKGETGENRDVDWKETTTWQSQWRCKDNV